MPDFNPETTITLYTGTCVDDANQPFFTDAGSKEAWYLGRFAARYQAYSYQREGRNYARVRDKAEHLRHCDMMSFKNADGTIVYCRIESIEFVNPNTCDIHYTVDYMQTYIEKVTFGKCWVEREMQEDDWNGSVPSFNNLMPEGIETGKMKRTNLPLAARHKNFSLVVLSLYDEGGEPNYTIPVENNYPCGVNKIVFDYSENSNMIDLELMLKTYEFKGIDPTKAIVGMFVVPRDYAHGGKDESDFTVTMPYPTIDGYTVVNAKCLTSEFLSLELNNNRGDSVELKPENFGSKTSITLKLEGGFGASSGGCILYPEEYEGNPYEFGVVRYDDIQAPFIGNSFASWIRGNSVAVAADIVGATAATIVNPVKTPVEKAVNIVSGAASTMASLYGRSKQPAGAGGQSAGSLMELITNQYKFNVNWVHPYAENLKCIDDYFSRFGYRTERFKVPNVNTRPYWNYVKTSNAVCRGGFPKAAQLYMENLMNNGVTFWHLGGGKNISDDWNPEDNKG